MRAPDVTRALWRKSTRSNGAGGDCVEVANLDATVGVRDSKAPDVGHLALTLQAWSSFVTEVKSGSFDQGTE